MTCKQLGQFKQMLLMLWI